MENRLLSVESCGEPLKGDSHALQHTVHSAVPHTPRLVYSFSGLVIIAEPAEASMTCQPKTLLLQRPWQDLH